MPAARPGPRRGLTRLLAAALAAGTPALVAAETEARLGDWQLHLRHARVAPGITDTIGLFITVEPLDFTELALSWRPSRWLAVEAAFTWPRDHVVRSAGFEVGRLRQLPPTLVLQGRWPLGWVEPYAGVGLSVVHTGQLRFAPAYSQTLQPTVRDGSVSAVWQLGLAWPLSRGWSLQAELKQLHIRTDLDAAGAQALGEFKVRPLLRSVGLSLRF